MNCPQCGAENPPESAFCNLCFARFGASRPADPASPPVAMPPGAQIPPVPQMPPGAGPGWLVASDAYGGPGGYGYGAPSAPIQPVKRMDPTLMWIIRVVVIVACFAAGWYATDWFLTRPRTFTSASTGISFTYPGKWNKVDASSFAMGVGLTGGSAANTELTLADGSSNETANNFLGVASVASTVDWVTAKSRWQAAYGSDLSKIVPVGVQVSTPTFTELTVSGNAAYSVKMTMTYMNTKYDCDVTIVQDGTTYHLLAFVSKPPKGNNTTFQDLLKTVKFKSDTQPSSLLRYREPALRA